MYKQTTVFFLLLLIIGGVFAQTSETSSDTPIVKIIEEPKKPLQTQPLANQMNMGANFDFGLPFSSFADPKYVAQQKFMESMTAVYLWIYANSKEVITKCDENKEELVSKVVSIINEAEETSAICKKFESQVAECNPELFCKNFQKGKLPIPPEMKIILKKMGKDPTKLTITDFTEDFMFEICKAQASSEIENKKAYAEKAKATIKSQLSNFRSKCDEFMKWKDSMTGPQIQLPDFYIPKMAPPKEDWKEPDKQGPKSKEDKWKEPIKDETDKQEPQPPTDSEQPPVTEPTPEPPKPEPEPTSAETTGSIISKTPVGLFGLATVDETPASVVKQPKKSVCGNNYCEPDLGENPENCHDDCTQGDFYKSSIVGKTMAPPMQGQGGPGMGSQGGGFGNPEMMCELTDEEIIDMYLPQEMTDFEDIEEQISYMCKTEASNMMSGINMMKLESAKCLANVALDCASKQKMVENCNTIQSNPESIAKFMVNNLCRQFGVKPIKHDLYELADKWLSVDPALAYELGDTVDTAFDEQKKLGFFSHIFGNDDYATNMKEKANKLNAIKQRIKDKNVEEPETVKVLEEQTKELNDEANRFGNFFNFSRFFKKFGK